MNQRIIDKRISFRKSVDRDIYRRENGTSAWHIRLNWAQILLIMFTTATASMAGFNDIPRAAGVIVGFAAATLESILSSFQLQDRIYSSRKALADLRPECHMYDHRIDEYEDRNEHPEKASLLFRKNVTAIQGKQMFHEVELLNPNKKAGVSDMRNSTKKDKPNNEEKLASSSLPFDGAKGNTTKQGS